MNDLRAVHPNMGNREQIDLVSGTGSRGLVVLRRGVEGIGPEPWLGNTVEGEGFPEKKKKAGEQGQALVKG